MKKLILISAIALMSGMAVMAQKAEVLYFKAQLGCCVARACDMLQNDIKTMVESNFDASEVVFKEVRLADPSNAELVQKFNARSQTVVVVRNGDSEKFKDISTEVRNYLRFRDREEFESTLVASVNENL
ncbi:hypothetical protein [Alkalitalea saponilacus]|uniref:Thioredoxin n=1 Tax=Alkalitalea saponilacus TaxID=889453 RepID=A0A1T5HT71_9BACT|nr:hypothetical protein [Alkalitalea saponilacus]ASB49236.1 hypothetical protein CDL62_08840 [Alkalitalea saponilacus]SKC23721.1 hypothetical protein SAMN03080601_03006 [Alkalitalea saponilacus]